MIFSRLNFVVPAYRQFGKYPPLDCSKDLSGRGVCEPAGGKGVKKSIRSFLYPQDAYAKSCVQVSAIWLSIKRRIE